MTHPDVLQFVTLSLALGPSIPEPSTPKLRDQRSGPLRLKHVSVWAVALLIFGILPVRAADFVEYVPARDYFEVAQREIAGAKKSVTVCLYLFSLRSTASDREVFRLAQSLVDARKAGAQVEVFLDQGAVDPEEGRGFNGPACAFFQGQGIPVFQDDASTVVHAKAIVIDDKTVLLGSTNWTDAALNKNLEANVLVRSTSVAQAALNDLRRANWRAVSAPVDSGGEVPLAFFQEERYFGAMAADRDERALDVALWLFSQSTGTFAVNTDVLTVVLGMGGWTREAARRQIIKTLNKLQNRYGLIRVDYSFSKDPCVTWSDGLRNPTAKEAGGVVVPEAYWALGWNRRLSLAGKSFYMISQIESVAAVTRPRWSVARTTLAERYHLSSTFISRGVAELRRQNLVEVEYGPLSKNGAQDRPPNIYTPNPLYDPVINEDRRAALVARVGPETVARAEKAARLIYEDSDRAILEELVDLESRYGRVRMDHALAVLGRMNVDNPKRNFPYLKGIVQSE